MKKSVWGERSRQVIERVVRENPDLSGEDLEKKVRAAYPFGMREYHPYKIWLAEVRRFFGKKTKPVPAGACQYCGGAGCMFCQGAANA